MVPPLGIRVDVTKESVTGTAILPAILLDAAIEKTVELT
jgi:hypothetical protein